MIIIINIKIVIITIAVMIIIINNNRSKRYGNDSLKNYFNYFSCLFVVLVFSHLSSLEIIA